MKVAMKVGTLVSIVLSIAGLTALVFAFVKNASPYVTVAEAMERSGDNLHLKGNIDQSSLQVNAMAGIVTFELTDETGQKATVVYQGPPPANMGEATEVVAVGGYKDGKFNSTKLFLKCPSKYESEAQAKA